MKLATPDMIPRIDDFSNNELSLSKKVLMSRAGFAVARATEEKTAMGDAVVILAGCGNNGGDGYAAAAELLKSRRVFLVDVLGKALQTSEAEYFRELYLSRGGVIYPLSEGEHLINEAAAVVDAMFGTGARVGIPEYLLPIAKAANSSSAKKIAVDLPLGVNAHDGSVLENAIRADVTVALSYVKPGLVSYPAKAFVGELILDTLGIPEDAVSSAFDFKYFLTDKSCAVSLLPKREENSNKGSFGKLLLITGSKKYRGAAHLTLGAALRCGAGIVSFLGDGELCRELRLRYPEAIYTDSEAFTREDTASASRKNTVTLIGSGSDNTEELRLLTESLISTEGGTLVLDADAINAIAGNPELLHNKKRPIVLTPHPMEFARLISENVDTVQQNRLKFAIEFAQEYYVTLVLKGACTVVTDGRITYINSTGSSALAKGGSGDVLAGVIASLISSGTSPVSASALGAYLHGAAADKLALEYSKFGVIPSDLPIAIARVIRELEVEKEQ